ncbi:MAG: sugar ABC transporter permease [Sneathiella sp.]|nr:sugar ABC transporter permease [Sneathiella sp.]
MRQPHAKNGNLKSLLGLIPATVVMLVFFVGALLLCIVQSLGYAPQYGINQFPTFQYYQAFLHDDGLWNSLGLTFYYAVVPTLIGAALSLFLSVAFAKAFKGRGFALFVYKIPLAVPYLVGVSIVILLFANGGLFARFFYAIGVISSPGDFPRFLQNAEGWGIMMVYLWKQVPFMTMMLYSNLLVLGREEEESALLLGASSLQIFFYVTLPRLMPALVGSTLIIFAFNFGSFEVPFILGAGYPNTLTVEAWRLFDDADYARRPEAMAIVTFVTFVSSLSILAYLVLYRRFERKRGRV